MKKFFGFGSSTPPPPPPPARPPSLPVAKSPAGKAAPTPKEGSSAGAPSIVGQWREPSGTDITEFRADGTVIEKPASGETIRGRYSLEGLKLKIRLEGVPEELCFYARIKTGALAMTDPDGQVTHYRRV